MGGQIGVVVPSPVSLQTPAPLNGPFAETLIDHVGNGIDASLLFTMGVDEQIQLPLSFAEM